MIVTDLSKSFHPVPKPSQKKLEAKPKKVQIKKKSSKLAKLESSRTSIITNDLKKCYICKANKKDDLHEIFGGKNRQTSMKHGLVIPVCRKCHSGIPKDNALNKHLHRVGQTAFEKTHTRDEFITTFGKSYL